jgi:hypothetical protein
MKGFFLLGALCAAFLTAVWDWPAIRRGGARERAAILSLIALGMLLSFLLIRYPELPGPSQLVDGIFRPFGKLLEK